MSRRDLRASLRAYLEGEGDLISELPEEQCIPDASPEMRRAALKKSLPSQAEANPVKIAGRSPFLKSCYTAAAVLCCITLIGFLLFAVAGMPTLGEDYAPADAVADRYVENGIAETGATNFVAGMILDYRAFDTLGESFVLFTALCCVMILLRQDGKTKKEEAPLGYYELKTDPILRTGAAVLLPAVLCFGIYIMLNGHLSPGGGFSGGAITGAGLILLSVAFGFETLDRFFTEKLFNRVCGCALGFYCLSKAYSFFCGANHLESGISAGTPGAILSAGLILPLNLAVGMVVSMTMLGIYCMFKRGRIGA